MPNLVTNCIVYGGGAGIECNHALVVNIVACQAYLTGKIIIPTMPSCSQRFIQV